MSYESRPAPPSELEQSLIAKTAVINDWVAARNSRGSHDGATMRKIAPKLLALTNEFKGTATYVQSPTVIYPLIDGREAAGPGELTGEIVGFAYRDYIIVNPLNEIESTHEGVVAIMALDPTTNVPGSTPDAWYALFPGNGQSASVRQEYIHKNVIPVLVPVTDRTRFTEISNPVPIHLSVDSMFAKQPEVGAQPPFNYREMVEKINSMANGRLAFDFDGPDGPLGRALLAELTDLNKQCPMVGKPVKISADYMRTPSLTNIGGHTIISGTEVGILRKFVYDSYNPRNQYMNMPAKGTVQAVIYPVEIAELVYSGRLSPQKADRTYGTLIVPLDLPHVLEPIIPGNDD